MNIYQDIPSLVFIFGPIRFHLPIFHLAIFSYNYENALYLEGFVSQLKVFFL